MEAVKLIGTGVAMLIGLILTPVVAVACESAVRGEANATGVYGHITPVANISGLATIIELVPFIYVFVLIGAGLLAMYAFYKD